MQALSHLRRYANKKKKEEATFISLGVLNCVDIHTICLLLSNVAQAISLRKIVFFLQIFLPTHAHKRFCLNNTEPGKYPTQQRHRASLFQPGVLYRNGNEPIIVRRVLARTEPERC